MATQVVLVRHGVTDWNEQGRLLGRSDIPLNQRGRAQAEAVGLALRDLAPGEIISSPQRRTLETAQIIAGLCKREVRTDDRLAEVWLRAWQGKTFADLHEDPDVHAYLRDPFHHSEEIEPYESVRQRISSLIGDLRDGRHAAPVVLVSHGDPLRTFIAEMLGLPAGQFRGFSVDNGSATTARIGRRKCHLQQLNWLPHGLNAGSGSS